MIKHWSQTQSTIALSPAGAELTGICKGSFQGLGLLAVARDLGMHWTLEVLTDATAAIGVCKMRGLGTIRHLSTADLWIQDKLRMNDFKITKVDGKQNIADLLTKHVPQDTLNKHVGAVCLHFPSGRAASAPQALI